MNKMHLLVAAGLLMWVGAMSTGHTAVVDTRFEGNLLEKVTPEWLDTAKVKHAKEFAYLRRLNDANGFPEGTLPTMWVVESMAGELNVRNRSGYSGHFQLGKYEAGKYCPGADVFQLKSAAECTVRLLRDYHMQTQRYSKDKIPWTARGMHDFYLLHNQGFEGSARHYNAIVYGDVLPQKVVRNVRGNVARQYKHVLYDPNGKRKAGVSDHDISVFFYRHWQYEMNRIWDAIK